MGQDEIEKLINSRIFPNQYHRPLLKETHISWVILTKKYVYKIKKPLHFSFLDFSTLEKRKYYCEREVELNKRLAGKMYLKTIPIFIDDKTSFSFHKKDNGPIDYTVMMNRMNAAKEMTNLLKKNEISNLSIEKLAKKIAVFHQNATVINNKFEINDLQQKYNDILTIEKFTSARMRSSFSPIIHEAVKKSDMFLKQHQDYLKDRSLAGFTRDIHGDLHSGNIFLYQNPVVFDCIEFNDNLRQIDVLDEIAFFCMDMEAFHRHDLSKLFYEKYLKYSEIKETKESKQLFNYYKSYRANIRAKINALNALQVEHTAVMRVKKNNTEAYLKLLKIYLQAF